MSIPTNNLKLAVEMATRVESALAKRVGDQPEVCIIKYIILCKFRLNAKIERTEKKNVMSCTQAQCATLQQATQQLKTQFEINDLADTDRILLTSKSIQNDIEEFSGYC